MAIPRSVTLTSMARLKSGEKAAHYFMRRFSTTSSSSTLSPQSVSPSSETPPLSPPSLPEDAAIRNKKSHDDDHPHFIGASKRRLLASPMLPLEGVSISPSVQTEVSRAVKSLNMRPKHLRANARRLQTQRAPETYNEKRTKYFGQPNVLPPPQYTKEETASFISIRFPGTFAANVHALAEVRRILPTFSPKSVLDFGAAVGTSVMAAARVMASPSFADRSKMSPNHSDSDIEHCVPHMPIKHAWIVDYSPAMKSVASSILRADSNIQDQVDILQTKTLSDGPPKHRLYDLVCASYSCNELVRSSIVKPDPNAMVEVEDDAQTPRHLREKVAEARLKRLVRSLWNRTAPGGVFVVVEDGTAAGFETILFVREAILGRYGINRKDPVSTIDDAESEDKEPATEKGKKPNVYARVIAPCLHSKKCPLDGSVTRHRICRFVQRLNRPPFQREANPTHNGFEDEYFSYIAIQKVANGAEELDRIHANQWGRLVRPPLMKTRHIVLDACTVDARLERRTVTKTKGPYLIARRSKWGDIWPVVPKTNPTEVNF